MASNGLNTEKLIIFQTLQCHTFQGFHHVFFLTAAHFNLAAVAHPKYTPNATKVSNVADGFTYDRTKFKIWTCKSLDDNWKAIGQTNKIKAGSCINLYFESQVKIKNLGDMRWGIFKVEADGKEIYVNQLDQGVGQLTEWRKLTYEECNAFALKGNYRIYISTKDDADAYFGVNNKNYFAKADLTVE